MKYLIHYKKRKEIGKEKVKKLRKQRKMPGVIYGKGEMPIPITIDVKELKAFLQLIKGGFSLVELEDENGNSFKAVIKAIQKDPLTDELLNIDFYKIHPHQIVEVSIPIHLEGEPKGVKRGGILDQTLYELPIKGSVDKIPSYVKVDISTLDIGDAIHVEDINLKGVQPNISPDTCIVSILHPRKEVVVKEAEVEAPPEKKPEEGEST